MAKVKWLAAELGKENFDNNTGWLQRFKIHHNTVGETISGESEAVSSQAVDFEEVATNLREVFCCGNFQHCRDWSVLANAA